MRINNIDFDVDFTDADFIEKIEQATQIVQEKSTELNTKSLSLAEGIRQECKIAKDFFDYVFGAGTSQKLFGEKNSLNDCTKALEEIMNAKKEQENEFEKRVSKYSPSRINR